MGKEYAERVVGASRQMDQLIRDLLDYGRLTHVRLPRAWVDLNKVVKEVVKTFSPDITAKKASVRIMNDFPHLFTNELVVWQVLTNLLSNALKFVREHVPPVVDISFEDRPDWVRISITDNGIGIHERFIQKIFGVFEKLHPPSHFPGTGIGLAIVSKGVERLGGRIGVTSQVDRGSCFWFELPKHIS
jgi:signal transduction histidine kinase